MEPRYFVLKRNRHKSQDIREFNSISKVRDYLKSDWPGGYLVLKLDEFGLTEVVITEPEIGV